MNAIHELTESMLVRFTQLDYSREMARIAVTGEAGTEVALGVARYTTNPDGKSCEFALVVADSTQGKGLGQKLMVSLMEAARDKGLVSIKGEILSENTKMLKLMQRLGFSVAAEENDPALMRASKAL